MFIETQPMPDGLFQHLVTANTQNQPAGYFSDSVLALERLTENPSLGYPMVTSYEANDGTWGVEVMLFSANPHPNKEEESILFGTLTEVLASAKL